jgi:hypothetical protein
MARHIHVTALTGNLTGSAAGSGEDAGARGANVSAILDQFDRAEGLLIDLLGQTDRDGACRWDTAWWEEVLDHAASLHARMLCARARLEQCSRAAMATRE